MVDIEATINTNTLDGNIYLIDNVSWEGSQGEATGHLTTAIHGAYWLDGSQAGEQLLNWLPGGISSLPTSLPRSFYATTTQRLDKQYLQNFARLYQKSHQEDSGAELRGMVQAVGGLGVTQSSRIKDAIGNIRELNLKVLNVFGEPFQKGRDPLSAISYLPPLITNITGQAVDEGVIYPAQYGTPIAIKDGWYWSASVDTNKVGSYAYTLHITVYKLGYDADEVAVWEPLNLTHDAYLTVDTAPKKNGFTQAAIGPLPIL
jgi:hypothetical protein